MQAILNWKQGLAFTGTADSGHEVAIDGPPDLGGQNSGARPMELMLMALGSCSAMDVVHILKKARQDVTDCRIEVEGQRRQSPPKTFTSIHIQFIVTGHNLDEKRVSRAVNLSTEKYCSAAAMLSKAADITHGYTIQSVD